MATSVVEGEGSEEKEEEEEEEELKAADTSEEGMLMGESGISFAACCLIPVMIGFPLFEPPSMMCKLLLLLLTFPPPASLMLSWRLLGMDGVCASIDEGGRLDRL